LATIRPRNQAITAWPIDGNHLIENSVPTDCDAMHLSDSHDAVIYVHDVGGNVSEIHEHNGDFKGL